MTGYPVNRESGSLACQIGAVRLRCVELKVLLVVYTLLPKSLFILRLSFYVFLSTSFFYVFLFTSFTSFSPKELKLMMYLVS